MTRASIWRGAAAVLRHASGTRDAVTDFQDRAVARLITHAAANVPFYRRHFAHAHVSPGEISGVRDLARLPVLTKDEFRAAPERDLLDQTLDPARLLSVTTSGSTGRPFKIVNSWREFRILHAFRLRAHLQFGRRLGDRFAEIDLPPRVHPNDHKLIGTTLRAVGLEARIQLSLHDPVEQLLDALEAFGPHIVTAYPSVLFRLGRLLSAHSGRRLRPRFLITNSEVLPTWAQAALEQMWQCQVFQFYDCHECNLIAWECPQGHGLHCNEDVAVVEVIRDGRPAAEGERGEVVITNLHSYAMPLIRFAMGDVAVRGPAPCPCGQPFATLRAIEGRIVDFFRLPGGRWLHPYRLIDEFQLDGADWVQQYRLIQEREDRIVFAFVPGDRATPERLAAFLDHARGIVGPQVEVEAKLMAALDLGPGGKFRPAQSLLPGEHRAPDWDTTEGSP